MLTLVSLIEPLETRIAPAGVFTFADVDGDFVTVKTSKGTDANLANIIAPYLSVEGLGMELQRIDFSQNPAAFNGTDLTVTAKRTSVGGDGLVNVGYIDATSVDGGGNLDLGKISISGDLGRIVAGDSVTTTAGVIALAVGSMGRYGMDTQAGGTPSQDSFITGWVGSVFVRGDIVGGSFIVSGVGTPTDGRLGALTIGGSLIGGSSAVSGYISASGNLGPVVVRGNVIGGDGDFSGSIGAGGAVASITIGGSLIGGGESGRHTGYLYNGAATMGPVKIGRDVIGGRDNLSGVITSGGAIVSVTIGGSLQGGPDVDSGRIAATGKLGPVSIGGDLTGTGSYGAGIIFSNTEIVSVFIRGSLVGGAATESGQIQSLGKLGKVVIGRDVRGGAGDHSGRIYGATSIASVSIGGSLIGGSSVDFFSGSIHSGGSVGPVAIGGDVQGGAGPYSGLVYSNTSVSTVTIGGSILGGTGQQSGGVRAELQLGFVKVGGDIIGRNGSNSGSIRGFASMAGVSIGGSLLGGSGAGSGAIFSLGAIGGIGIGGDLRGSDNSSSSTLSDTGTIIGRRIASITIGGSVVAGRELAGSLIRSGSIHASDDIGPIVIRGSLVGNAANPVVVSARGQSGASGVTDLAVKSLSVGGNVEYSSILVGYNREGFGQNADAQIGPVVVGRDWIASNLLVGVDPFDGQIGDANDRKLAGNFGPGPVKDLPTTVSKIASVVIRGGIFGTPSTVSLSDRFGFVAEQIGSFSVNGLALPLTAGPSNNTFALGKAQPIGAGRSTGTPDSFEVHVVEV